MTARVLVLGATGTIGRAVVAAALAEGRGVDCLLRPHHAGGGHGSLEGAALHFGTVAQALDAGRAGAVICCMASRSGAPADAWAVDHAATVDAIAAAQDHGAQFVLLSAICVQRPMLEFQRAKLAAEAALAASGLRYSIVRPTAYFKSLSGQVARLRAGKPFLLFGDGRGTACKPISDGDLARYMLGCLDDPARGNRVLPIGGPGPAITPLEQGAMLFDALGMEPRYRHVPLRLMDGIVGALALGGRLSARLADKAELARIGRYYATESMLVLNPATGRYDADATPETGAETLAAFYGRLARGEAAVDLGAHSVF
ncbi:divinyl chlorophyllide a 8-vinyl-reductase [Roseovarius sp. MBR-78]|jgi:divinyl chlorophyllide a 8-vinyl-reductase|uniref:NAD(P)H-binding protein n=1 Tax=Roseovarius sp. MBR-78 TaxID=3156460 RepID=UPI003395DFC8